ncbi:DUF4232 domain-containing protein [Actinoplanes solisilvae]|uniref:DUF4232 domain-containing protein n=1 Tax=Actinoplanes solisilvae TaxID=2486853 RepID=UPI000FDC3F17|nr:DUF4232 domain-containing protein [Actinoplanes solisilvae]
MKRLLALLAAPALLLTGCSTSTDTTTTTPAPAPTTAPTTTSPEPEPEPTTATTTRPTQGGGGGSSTTRCRTADLTLKTGDADAGAGSRSVNLIFTNKSQRTCTLFGYPGVSWVAGAKGTQVNEPFNRQEGAAGRTTVTLKPGGVAYSLLIWPFFANFDEARCKPVEVRGYRVFPPDETASAFVSSPQTVCSAKGVGLGMVQPVTTTAG